MAKKTAGLEQSHWVFSPRLGFDRALSSIPAVIQLVIAVTAAYAISRYLLGHAAPITAVTVTLSSLGFARDARPVRVLQSAIGITLGVTLSEIIIVAFGQGIWQVVVTLFVALMVARFFSASPQFAVMAGVQSVLVSILPVMPGGPYLRTVDSLIGGAIALLSTALLPRDPRRAALADARLLLRDFSEIVSALVSELRLGHDSDISRVLEKARATQPFIDRWRLSLDSAIAIAMISPIVRRHLTELREQKAILAAMDLAVRDLRVVTRRLGVLMRDGKPRPELVDLFLGIATGVDLLTQGLNDPKNRLLARQSFIEIAVRLDPRELFLDQPVLEGAIIVEMRPLLLDLLCATGMSSDEARSELPDIRV